MKIEKPPHFDLTKIGFDLDGTLDRPEVAALARVLYAAGVQIHILTVGAIMSERDDSTLQEDYDAMVQRKVQRLEFLAIPYHELHVVVGDTFEEAGREKAALINAREIPIMFDDSGSFVKAMVEDTTAIIMHLKPGGNEDEDSPSTGD